MLPPHPKSPWNFNPAVTALRRWINKSDRRVPQVRWNGTVKSETVTTEICKVPTPTIKYLLRCETGGRKQSEVP